MIPVNSVPLNQVCDIGNGFAFKSTQFQQSGVPLLRISNISNSRVSFGKGTVFLEETHLTTHKNFLVNKGDVVIALSGATTGKYGVYLHEEPCLLNQRIGIIRKGESEKLNLQYFYFYLTKLKSEILSKAQGAAQPNISTKDIGQFKIPLPPLHEQQKIAAILDAADQLRQKDQQLIEHYTRLGQALFLEMFGDPVGNPMGWEEFALKSLFSASPRIGTTTPASEDGITKVVRVGEIGQKQINFSKCKNVNLNEKEQERYLLCTGDIVLARAIGSISHLGKASLFESYNTPVVFDSHVMRLRFDHSLISPEFFYNWMQSAGGRAIFLKNSGQTAVQFNINAKQISGIKIKLPPIVLQNQFAQHIEAIEQQKQSAQSSLEKSEALFNSLLQRAFKGELTGKC